jgi:hypothetical protein
LIGKKITKGGQNHKIISKNNFEQKTTITRMIIKFEGLKKTRRMKLKRHINFINDSR